jgi:hypothetical protein
MTPPSPPEQPTARAARHPAALPPLRWGDAATRLWAGSWLIVGGGVAIAGSNTEALWVLTIGTLAHVAGWCMLPAAGWRRTVAVAPATLTMWLLLAGPRFVIVLVVPYLLWLLVRHRSALSALTALPVAAVALLVGDVAGLDYARMLPALAVVGVTMVVGAWTARLIDGRRAR